MRCPRCKNMLPEPAARSEPRLHCPICGARLFAWLGDPFGVRDGAPVRAMRRAESDGVNWIAISFFLFAVLFALSCICLAGLNS